MASSSSTKWPNGAKAAITLTIDNMGEAADLQRNLWPKDQPIGSHYSVTSVLPKFLSLLDKHSIKATYYTEAWNTTVYPDALRSLVSNGHEVSWHAYQHEPWGKYAARPPEEERDNFRRSFSAIESLQPHLERYTGFRPPGGLITPQTLRLCHEYGVKYLSPAAADVAIVTSNTDSAAPTSKGGPGDPKVVILPFTWPTVDAYYYMTSFTGLRAIKNEYPDRDPSSPLPPLELQRRYIQAIDDAIARGGYLAPLFHPFLTDQEDRLEAMDQVLAYVARKRAEGEVWIAKAAEVDKWVREHESLFGGDPGWDLSSWR